MSGISNWATDNYFDLLYTWLHLLYVYRIFSVVRNDLYLTYHMSVLNLCRLPKNTPHVFYRYKDWDFKWLSDARIWCFCLRHDLSFFFEKKYVRTEMVILAIIDPRVLSSHYFQIFDILLSLREYGCEVRLLTFCNSAAFYSF